MRVWTTRKRGDGMLDFEGRWVGQCTGEAEGLELTWREGLGGGE